MKPDIVYPDTRPRSQRTRSMTKMVHSMSVRPFRGAPLRPREELERRSCHERGGEIGSSRHPARLGVRRSMIRSSDAQKLEPSRDRSYEKRRPDPIEARELLAG